jgi:hypothetical protein
MDGTKCQRRETEENDRERCIERSDLTQSTVQNVELKSLTVYFGRTCTSVSKQHTTHIRDLFGDAKTIQRRMLERTMIRGGKKGKGKVVPVLN